MKVKGLDGRTYPWRLDGRTVGKVDEVERSNLHLRVREFLSRLFPSQPLLEEVFLPGSGGLRADFYLPVRKTIVEAHGEQHLEWVPYFHTRGEYLQQQVRDRTKIEWCELNSLRLVALHHDESEDTWKGKLLNG